MTNIVEFNSEVPLRMQMADCGTEAVVLVNIFQVQNDSVDRFLINWAASSRLLETKPGFVSTQLHRGIAGSTTFLNYAVWENAAAYREAMGSHDVRALLQADKSATSASPYLFRTVVIDEKIQ